MASGAHRVGVRYGCWPLALSHRLNLAHRPQPRPCFACPCSDLFMVHFDEQPHAQYLISGGDGSGKVVMHA